MSGVNKPVECGWIIIGRRTTDHRLGLSGIDYLTTVTICQLIRFTDSTLNTSQQVDLRRATQGTSPTKTKGEKCPRRLNVNANVFSQVLSLERSPQTLTRFCIRMAPEHGLAQHPARTKRKKDCRKVMGERSWRSSVEANRRARIA